MSRLAREFSSCIRRRQAAVTESTRRACRNEVCGGLAVSQQGMAASSTLSRSGQSGRGREMNLKVPCTTIRSSRNAPSSISQSRQYHMRTMPAVSVLDLAEGGQALNLRSQVYDVSEIRPGKKWKEEDLINERSDWIARFRLDGQLQQHAQHFIQVVLAARTDQNKSELDHKKDLTKYCESR